MNNSGNPALVLNADFRPLSYYPLSLCSWQDAVKSVFSNRVTIIESYDKKVHSPSTSFHLPSVIALKDYIMPQRKPAFTRFNVFLRDGFVCQYCSSPENLTFDHLIPRSKGGKTTWSNVVTACSACNFTKGGKLESECKMYPLKRPKIPSMAELQEKGRLFPPNYLHDSWRDFLYWDSELEP